MIYHNIIWRHIIIRFSLICGFPWCSQLILAYHTFIHSRARASMHSCLIHTTYTTRNTYVCTYIYIYIHIHIHIHTHLSLYIYIYMYTSLSLYLYIHIHINIYIYIYIYMYRWSLGSRAAGRGGDGSFWRQIDRHIYYIRMCICMYVCMCCSCCSTDSLNRPAVYFRQASYLSITLPQLAG